MGRTRETVTGSLTNSCTWYLDGAFAGSYTGLGKQETKRIEDTVIPGFHALKKCGKYLPFNLVLITTDTIEKIAGPVNARDISAHPPHVFSGEYYENQGHLIAEPVPSSALTDAAVLAAAARAASSAFDVLTWVAEIGESVDTIARIIHAFNQRTRLMAELAAEFRAQSRGRRVTSAFEIFTELWLQARFGIRPMIYDAQGIARALAAKLAKDLLITGSGMEGQDVSDDEDTGWTNFNYYWDRRIVTKLRGDITHHGWAAVEFASQNKRRWGFDPLVTAWEKIPYSFVVDYFIGVGSWIKTLLPSLRGDYKGIGFSLKHEWELETTLTYRGKSPATDGSWGPQIFRTSRKRYIREPTSIPYPPLLPNLTLPRMVDLVALVMAGRSAVSQILLRADRNAAWSQNQYSRGGIGAGNY